mgnify:CR=1 FL=1
MATITKQFLSASTNGKGIKVAATASAGTTIHQAVANTTDMDEVWLYASNTSASAVILTIEFGDVGDVQHNIVTTVAASSTELVVPGLILQNSLYAKAFAGSANVVTVFGYVNHLNY